MALKFNFTALLDYAILGGKFNVASDTNDLQVGYPVLIYDTTMGRSYFCDSDNNAVVGMEVRSLIMSTKYMQVWTFRRW